MASYRAIAGALNALKDALEDRIVGDLDQVVTSPTVRVLATQDLRTDPSGEALGIYLHRISVDAFGRNRYLQPTQSGQPRQPELPVNLHVLLIGWTTTALNEGALLGWGMQQIGASLDLDIAHMGGSDPLFGENESLQVLPEDMSTEDLLRIWDGLPRDYILSTPYLIKTLRLAPNPAWSAGPPVQSIVTPMGTR